MTLWTYKKKWTIESWTKCWVWSDASGADIGSGTRSNAPFVPFSRNLKKKVLPKWIYLTACFLTSPFSIYFVVKDRQLTLIEKLAAVSGCCFWLAFYLLKNP